MSLGSFLWKVGTYGITIILGLISALWLLGRIASRYGPLVPDFEGFDPEDEEEGVRKYSNSQCRTSSNRAVVISDFEASTVDHFIRASITGSMPGGERTSLPLFPEAELESHFSKRYADWALEPWSSIPLRPTADDILRGDSSKGGDSKESPSPLLHVTRIVSGLDTLINASTPRPMMWRSMKSMKSKVLYC
jgi:hypothetical protein